jgi:uncharacterized lipoprotein YehR (DUF1307 family)
MNILSIKNLALSLTLAASVFTATAQTKYSEGVANYNVNASGQDVEVKCYFKGDSSSYATQRGPATITLIGTLKNDFFAVLVDVPVMGWKKGATANPGELEEGASMIPEYTFTPSTETKKIGDYNCKKFTAKDAKANTSYELWTTTDINLPPNIISRYYTGAGGTPVMFTIVQQGVTQIITLKSVTESKVPATAFKVPADYEKITMDDLKSLGGRKQ